VFTALRGSPAGHREVEVKGGERGRGMAEKRGVKEWKWKGRKEMERRRKG